MAAPSSSSTEAFSNLSCARCHKTEEDLGERLKQCAGCHTVKYCSRECQRLQWSAHKVRCHALREGTTTADTQNSGRTTMRVNMAGLQSMLNPTADTAIEDDTIYYLKTSTPHIHDISMSGPYHSLEAIAQQMYHNFGDEYAHGRSMLADHLSLVGIEHITSPSKDDPNKTRTCRIIKEKNAEVKATLPGPALYVVSCEGNQASAEAPGFAAGMTNDSPAPMKSMHVHGAFTSRARAIARVREVAGRIAARIPGAKPMELGSDFAGTRPGGIMDVVVQGSVGGEKQMWLITLRYDSGVIHPVES